MTGPFAALLFDIDGTLVRCGGAGRRAFERALADEVGPVDGRLEALRFDGMTDRLIAREALGLLGAPHGEARCDAILDRYVGYLQEEIADGGFRVLPGVAALLEALVARGSAFGLCTGNVLEGARTKLRRGALDRFFDWSPSGMHGFAGDGERREEVVRAAVRRVADRLGRPVAPVEVLVIGDTPRDIWAAHHVGCPVLAVATGNFTGAALAAEGAEVVAETLEDVAAQRLLLA